MRGTCQVVLTLWISLSLFPSCGSCSFHWEAQDNPDTYTFLSYNVHNLFDDRDDGAEYPEYSVAKGKWGTAPYQKKLENLAKVVKESSPGGADFLAFYEIENQRVLKDLVETYLPRMGYREYSVALSPQGGMGIGFITRLPVKGSRTHQPLPQGFPQRPILEVEVSCGVHPLTVFLCHFKSKSEGAEATERNRVASAELLRRRIRQLLSEDPGREILILGDLNENIDEYQRVSGKYKTAITPLDAAESTTEGLVVSTDQTIGGLEKGTDVLFSPWLFGTERDGSYVYKGKWETIDHVLLSLNLMTPPQLVFESFRVVKHPFLLTDKGEPNPTYSDHLPLRLELKQVKNP